MSDQNMTHEFGADAAPGDQETGPHQIAAGIRNYLIGLGLAAALTVGSFWVASGTSLVYTPGVYTRRVPSATQNDPAVSPAASASPMR